MLSSPGRRRQSAAMHIPHWIEHRRECGELESEGIPALIEGFTSGEMSDCQMTALAPAIFFHGMSPVETAGLAAATRESRRISNGRPALRRRSTNVIRRLDAKAIGPAGVLLGAERMVPSDEIDFAVGFSGICKTGQNVAKGEELLTIHARDHEGLDMARQAVAKAIGIE